MHQLRSRRSHYGRVWARTKKDSKLLGVRDSGYHSPANVNGDKGTNSVTLIHKTYQFPRTFLCKIPTVITETLIVQTSLYCT
jgi:hypothetical protein